LFEDSTTYDIGLYDYTSGARRIRHRESISLDVHARELAGDLRDGKYDRIVLIGHSMGGLLCKAVIKYLIDSQAQASGGLTIERVVGLFLMATPQAGSLRVPRLSAYFTKDGKVLRAHSEFVQEINRRFNDRVCSDNRNVLGPADRYFIPTYAVLATGDVWVDEFSSTLNLPSDQIKYVRSSHRSVVKPESREGELYSWIFHKIDDCFTVSAPEVQLRNPVKQLSANQGASVSARGSDIDAAFRDARGMVAEVLQARGSGSIDVNININVKIMTRDGSS
jgi:hypothetical protein